MPVAITVPGCHPGGSSGDRYAQRQDRNETLSSPDMGDVGRRDRDDKPVTGRQGVS